MSRARALLAHARDLALLLAGVPSYQRYLAHMRARHPDRVPMSEGAFRRDRQAARYGGGGPGGCC